MTTCNKAQANTSRPEAPKGEFGVFMAEMGGSSGVKIPSMGPSQ
uniref:Uncharacterized protein n=1 Tax=Solanum tuberosum TaxID=4113 RepID=M1ABU4_SOLTU